MKQFYIYLTTNKITNEKYIGQHYGELDDSYFGSGTIILKALKKYGKNNFSKEILTICESREDANEKEIEYIKKYNAVEDDNFYNLANGGECLENVRELLHQKQQQEPDHFQQLYKENGERLQQWRFEHPIEFQDQVIKPMLEGSRKYWEEHPEKRQLLMQKVNQKKIEWQQSHPEEHKREVEKWIKSGSEANSQKIRCITTDKIFSSQCEAARFYNIPQTNISKALKGERKSAGKDPMTGKKLFWEKL